MKTLPLIRTMLDSRIEPQSREWLATTSKEIAAGVDDTRMCVLFSAASRAVKTKPLAPTGDERGRAHEALAGWNPERWTVRDAARILLIGARRDLEAPTGVRAIDELFRYADVGEGQALYRALPHLPHPERFLSRAREGARSNMRAYFEAIACDSPYPSAHFDALAFRQLAIKALFIEAPLWRVFGFDARVDAELARMALDLADERRSAGRPVNPELWMCLGRFGGARGLASIQRELANSLSRARAGAALALARAGEKDQLAKIVAGEKDELVGSVARSALAGNFDQGAFRALDPNVQGNR